MIKWVLGWSTTDEELFPEKENFKSKSELLKRLEELKWEYRDSLEYEFYKVKKCVKCHSLIKIQEKEASKK